MASKRLLPAEPEVRALTVMQCCSLKICESARLALATESSALTTLVRIVGLASRPFCVIIAALCKAPRTCEWQLNVEQEDCEGSG